MWQASNSPANCGSVFEISINAEAQRYIIKTLSREANACAPQAPCYFQRATASFCWSVFVQLTSILLRMVGDVTLPSVRLWRYCPSTKGARDLWLCVRCTQEAKPCSG